ncbi:probable E3 ubiquitin-protein ligase RHY1A [Cryptomeria japonica]|uniref:probable E3 ubiquitin-protein ligase RHY1A n=1 Tax=Cryptomeria japonica TaxID=3369 RepID=UPI0025ACEE68|nr:probable E3 ubiquitin-protein ligase RHY1A [Cryptomeria japonica]XP_057820093.1 probable E3 ubiquitin-protein ligase RHY1A [Cryptomeria japonica]XP_057820094.1 probable E3 ubiquitin-protein ligase RHY1A [Cryptomeria japonica]XP_057820095.1 probable E3 ubiquitin-protein ligase RHY1A [Cryptomeria japonica]
MAGMLPGVEFARRRRFHQGGSGGSLIKQATRPISEFRAENRDDNKLNEVALEARERLEERLRASSSSPVNKRLDYITQRRVQSGYRNSHIEERSGINERNWHASTNIDTSQPRELVGLSKGFIDNLKREIYTPTRTKENPLLKLLPRTSEQVDCPICLDCFQLNQVIIHLPCRHKFHPNCLIPWLEKNNHCPYCRTKVLNKPS